MSITCSSISNYLSVLPVALKISGSRARLIRSDCEHPVTAIKLSEAFFSFSRIHSPLSENIDQDT